MKSDFHHCINSSNNSTSHFIGTNPFQKALENYCFNMNFSNRNQNNEITQLFPVVDKKLMKKKQIKSVVPFVSFELTGVIGNFYNNCVDWTGNKLLLGLNTSIYLLDIYSTKTSLLIPSHHSKKSENELASVTCVKSNSSNISQCFCGDFTGNLCSLDLQKNMISTKIHIHNDRIGRILSFDSYCVLTGSKDCSIRLFDQRNEKHWQLNKNTIFGEICGLTKNDHYLAVSTSDSNVFLYDLRMFDTPLSLDRYDKSSIKAICFEKERHNILVSGGGISTRKIERWNYSTNEKETIVVNSQVISIDYEQRNGYFLVTLGHPSNNLLQFDNEWNFIREIKGHNHQIISTSGFSNEIDTSFATLSTDGMLKIWKHEFV